VQGAGGGVQGSGWRMHDVSFRVEGSSGAAELLTERCHWSRLRVSSEVFHEFYSFPSRSAAGRREDPYGELITSSLETRNLVKWQR